jgi:hypothetical protein
MYPDVPPIAEPLPILIWPLFPLLAVPELNASSPLSPLKPAFADLITIAPLDDGKLSPLLINTDPPVSALVVPEMNSMSPPDPLFPSPTSIAIIPPVPPIASPVPNRSAPVLPLLEVPELKVRTPLTPLAPLFSDLIEIAPLVVKLP